MPEQTAKAAHFAAQLAALREQFAHQLGGTLDEMVARADGHDASGELLRELHGRLHKLAGSGGTFGFTELSRQARVLEVSAKTWLDTNLPAKDAWTTWLADLQALRQSIAPPAAVRQPATQPPTHGKPRGPVRIALIEDDPVYGETLQLGLSLLGYEVTHHAGFSAAESAILADPPDILVAAMMEQLPAIPKLFERMGQSLPTLFLAAHSDFAARLAVAAAGGDAFLVKPADAPSVANRIEMLLQEREMTPYRVLIVEDDEVLAEQYRLALAAAGMLAEKVCQPQETLAAMQNLSPDLILMDLYMPGCSGADLARVIRYDEAWTGVPIVYLSAEGDLDKQTKAMDSGADDFLTKPISTQRLVGAVRARAARARKMAELMSQDSLTGLLKHGSIKERLAQEFDRAERQHKPLAAVMVDIDDFKRVNDTWGHPVGDQVIKTLGHLLRQRLRRQDSIGRYGGEEFVAVLPECTSADAVRLLEDIRQSFAAVRFVHQGEDFVVTLSAGIASSEHYADAQELLAAADAALYVAKHGGRNQVRFATADQVKNGRE